MAYSEIYGDLLDPIHGFQVIGHGVNLQGVMGAGIENRSKIDGPLSWMNTWRTVNRVS